MDSDYEDDDEDILYSDDDSDQVDSSKEDSYRSLSSNELFNCMNEIISETGEVIHQVTRTQLRVLLSRFRWDKELLLEKYYMGEKERKKLFEEVHIVIEKNSPENLVENINCECEICFTEIKFEHMIGLNCQHKYCDNCWSDYLRTKIVEEGQSQTISCPTPNCNVIVDDELVMSLVKDKSIQSRYLRYITDCFVQCNRNLTWCPEPDCNHVIQTTSPGEKLVICQCGREFCFKCSESWHAPLTCLYLKKWLKKCADDSETSHWINAHTKECPRCKIVIEKNGGCNHMVCRSSTCKYEFCWTCLGAWEPHGPQWYTCNRYDKNEKAKEAQETSRSRLQRYLFYFDRYANHMQSLKFEHKLHSKINVKMEELKNNLNWTEARFIQQALDVLCECRQTLMYTYVFAFYLKPNNQSVIFEQNQADLENSIEQLSEFLERDINEVSNTSLEMRQKVQNKSVYCEKRRGLLLEHVYEGYEEDWWVYSE